MIVDDECSSVPFRDTRGGDIWRCPQSQGWFMTVEADKALTDGLNCVRLNDGMMMSRAQEWTVDFYRGARLVVP